MDHKIAKGKNRLKLSKCTGVEFSRQLIPDNEENWLRVKREKAKVECETFILPHFTFEGSSSGVNEARIKRKSSLRSLDIVFMLSTARAQSNMELTLIT